MTIRRLVTAVAAALVLVGLGAAPAAAQIELPGGLATLPGDAPIDAVPLLGSGELPLPLPHSLLG